jgi:glutaminyl-peptide cyclotransferase
MARPGVWADTFLVVLLSGILVFSSCSDPVSPLPTGNEVAASQKKISVPAFQADSAYRFIAEQVGFGPRVPNSVAHDRCADYLIAKFRAFGLSLQIQDAVVSDYAARKDKIRNIMASFNPEAKTRILLCSHWDSRSTADQDSVRKNEPIDGADDGASGVGVLLEIARILHHQKVDVGVDLLLVDAEDTGQPNDIAPQDQKENTWCLGTQYWTKHLPPGYTARYGILLDMVGAKNAMFAMEGHSMQFADDIVKKVWGIAADLGYSNYFLYAKGGTITDDHFYINQDAHIPTIDILNYDPVKLEFGYYHHRHSDNMSIIDTKTLQAVGQTLLQTIYSEIPY